MPLTDTIVGTNTIGASSQTPATNVAYVKSVTVPEDHVLSTVEAYLRLTDNNLIGYRVGVWGNSAGAPTVMLHLSQPKTDSVQTGPTDRWMGDAVGIWFPATTTVWIGIQLFDPASATLAYETTGGTDRTITSGSIWTGEAGSVGVTVSGALTTDYSIRGVLIS